MGFDPFFHYEYSMALVQGKTSIDVVTQFKEHLTLYYPPLFHLLSLSFFLAFPTIDPYLIMKVLVSMLDTMQILPIYFIVRYLTKSNAGAAVAAFAAMIMPSNFNMISWGGYANIAGLLLMAILTYLVMTERALAIGVTATVLFLTHHLSMLFAVAVFLPFFLTDWWRTRTFPKCLLAFLGAGAVAYLAFYWYALIPLYTTYTTFGRHAQFTMPANWPQLFGYPLLAVAAAGIGLQILRARTRFAKPDLLLYVWLLLPILLGYAYMFGIQWNTVRWIYFLQPLACIWVGRATAHFGNRKLIVAVILLMFIIQLFSTLQTYNATIWANSGYSY